jgi:hypothetical protein
MRIRLDVRHIDVHQACVRHTRPASHLRGGFELHEHERDVGAQGQRAHVARVQQQRGVARLHALAVPLQPTRRLRLVEVQVRAVRRRHLHPSPTRAVSDTQ